MEIVDVKNFEFEQTDCRPRQKRNPSLRKPRYKVFIRGPIDFEWVKIAARLPGKAWLVGTAIWYVVGMAKSNTVKIQGRVLADLNVSRKAFNRALSRLEDVGLVTVNRKQGRSPEITLLPAPQGKQEQNGETPSKSLFWRRNSRPSSKSPRKEQDNRVQTP